MNKRRPLHLSLIRTIATINGDDQESVDSAVYVARLTSEVTLPGNHLAEMLQVVNRQLRTLKGDFADETRILLGKVRGHISEQVQNQARTQVDKDFNLETYVDPTNNSSSEAAMA